MKELNSQKLQNLLRNKFLKSGVKMSGAETIYFSKDTKIGKNVTIFPLIEKLRCRPNLVAGEKGDAGNGHLMQDHPPRFFFAWHDEACSIFEKWRQLVRLFETVMEDLGVHHPFIPKVAVANAMQFPFGEVVGQFGEGRPQFPKAFDFQVAPHVKDFLG